MIHTPRVCYAIHGAMLDHGLLCNFAEEAAMRS